MADTVLVTGGSGFIGSHVSKALVERGDRVINFDIQPWGGAMAWLMAPYKEQIIFEQGSVEHWSRLLGVVKKHKVNKIAHLAASIDVQLLSRRPKLAFDSMAIGAIHALEATRLLDIERLVMFSSIGILPGIQYEPIDANHPTVMASEGPGAAAYGAAKLTGEAFCWAYRQAYDVDFVTIRPSAIYGFLSRNPIYINEMVQGAVRGEPVHFDHGGQVPRDYTHVTDVAGIAAAALNAPSARLQHRVFYAATGQPLVTASQVAEIIKEMIPSADIQIKPDMADRDKMEIRFRGLLDVKPVETQLGYKIKYPNLREGVAEFIELCRQYFKQ